MASDPSEILSSRRVARLVVADDAPACRHERDVLAAGGQVTRLRIGELLRPSGIDGVTARFLGRLYDGLIVPGSMRDRIPSIAMASGIPVVPEDEPVPSGFVA